MPGRLLGSGSGAPSPNPAAPRSFPRPRRAKPHLSDPLPRPGRGASPRRGARAALCARCPHPPNLRRRTGWGREASAPASPTPRPRAAAAEAQARSRSRAGAGAGTGAARGDQAEWGEHPRFFCRGGGSRSLHGTAQGGGGYLAGGGRYKYLQIVSSGTGGGEGSALGCKWEWRCLSQGAMRSREAEMGLGQPWWPEVR